MSKTVNQNQTFRAHRLAHGQGQNGIASSLGLRIVRPLDAEALIGRHESAIPPSSTTRDASMSIQLHKRVGSSRAVATAFDKKHAPCTSWAFDGRQRAIVKLHYFAHSNGGGAALKRHVRYIGRDAASRADDAWLLGEKAGREGDLNKDEDQRGAAAQRSPFYDATRDDVSGARLADQWAKSDRRHFRIILSAEQGGRIADLASYTRDVLERAEAALGTSLEWIAVNHFDTASPHTHIVLRGVREDGRDLIIPRAFVQHGFRYAARDAATARLGERTPDHERQALLREASTHAPTRLDVLIYNQLNEAREVRLADLRAPNGSPDMTDALKARARELKHLGLAQEVRRNVFRFEPAWREALKTMELHLDLRKSLMQARAQAVTRGLPPPQRLPDRKELRFPFGLGL